MLIYLDDKGVLAELARVAHSSGEKLKCEIKDILKMEIKVRCLCLRK